MGALYSMLVFLIVLGIVSVAGYVTYRYFNGRIIGSTTVWQLLCYSLLMIIANLVILFGGIWVLVVLYDYLARTG